jgi:K+-sensing histidine kinase KdpD
MRQLLRTDLNEQAALGDAALAAITRLIRDTALSPIALLPSIWRSLDTLQGELANSGLTVRINIGSNVQLVMHDQALDLVLRALFRAILERSAPKQEIEIKWSANAKRGVLMITAPGPAIPFGGEIRMFAPNHTDGNVNEDASGGIYMARRVAQVSGFDIDYSQATHANGSSLHVFRLIVSVSGFLMREGL